MHASSRSKWLIAILVVAVVAVVWSLAKGPDTAAPETVQRGAVPALIQTGYGAMDQRENDPVALDRALDAFERAYALDSTNLDARFGLAWARQVKGLPESEWRGLYEKTIDEGSLLTYLAMFNLGYAERRAGRPVQAVALLERAVKVMPLRMDGWLELARAYEAAGRDADTRRAMMQAEALGHVPASHDGHDH